MKKSKIYNESKNITFEKRIFKLQEIGFELIRRDIGTAYHNPIGILAAYGPKSYLFRKYINQTIETNRICPTILKIFKINIPDYMNMPLF